LRGAGLSHGGADIINFALAPHETGPKACFGFALVQERVKETPHIFPGQTRT
jgi:hypothetical protein